MTNSGRLLIPKSVLSIDSTRHLIIRIAYLKNTYRVLLTRARQGMVIFIPKGSDIDHRRRHGYYDATV